jgi:hypothetical protein
MAPKDGSWKDQATQAYRWNWSVTVAARLDGSSTRSMGGHSSGKVLEVPATTPLQRSDSVRPNQVCYTYYNEVVSVSRQERGIKRKP